MSENFGLNKLTSAFQQQKSVDLGENLERLKKEGSEEIRDIKDTPLFGEDNKFNEDLLTKEGFVQNLYDGTKFSRLDDNEGKVTKYQLSDLYDALESVSQNGKVSQNELELLASLGDGDKGSIDKTDLKSLVDAAQGAVLGEEAAVEELPQSSASLKEDERIKEDENGNKYVEVEDWASSGSANGSLESIIQNSYDLEKMGISKDSDVYKGLKRAVMEANPGIYGTEEGGWRTEAGGKGRENAVLYTGEKFVLPELLYDSTTGTLMGKDGKDGAE